MKKLLLTLSLLILSVPAMAAPAITADGATNLKTLAVAALAKQAASLKSSGMTLQQQGDVVVEEAGTYYAITTPNLSIQMPGGVTRTLGMIAINAIPTDKTDVYKMAIALPTPILDTNASGARVGQIDIGAQNMSGLYNFATGAITEFKGDYSNVDIAQASGKTIAIAHLTSQASLTDQGNGLVSGPVQTSIEGLKTSDSSGSYNIAKLQINAMLDHADAIAASLMRLKIQQEDNQNQIISLVRSYLGNAANGLDLMTAASGITFNTKFKDGKTSSGAIATSNTTVTIKNAQTPGAAVAINSSTQGLSFDDPNSKNFAPGKIILQAQGSNVPLKKILSTPNVNFLDVFKQPGSKWLVRQMDIQAPSYNMTATADLTGQPNSPIGTSGNVKMTMSGIEALTQWLADPNGAAASGVSANMQVLVPIIAMVQMTGKPVKDAQGRDARSFDLQIQPDGSVMLNGVLVSAAPAARAPKP